MNTEVYKHALFCLDLSDSDDAIIKMAKQLKLQKMVETVSCIHVIDNDLEEKIRHHYDSKTWDELKNEIFGVIELKLKNVFENDNALEITVIGGSALETIDYQRQKISADLLIVGKKSGRDGVISKQLARKSKSDIIFVPDNFNSKFSSTLVAFDFSEHAVETLKLSIQISNKLKIKDNNAIYIIPSPMGYFQSGRLHKNFLDAEKAESLQKWNALKLEIGESNLPDISIIENIRNNASYYVEEMANKLESPLIFLGSKGKTASAAFLLGSVTEKMINAEIVHPILIHKMSGENFDLLDGLFK